MKLLRPLFLAAAIFVPASAAFADNAVPVDTPSLANELKLSKEQRQKIEAIRKEEEKRLDAIDVSKLEPGVFRDMIKAGKWDEAKAQQRINAITDAEKQVMYIRIKSLFDMSQVLTAEQKQQFIELFRKELNAE